MQVNWTKGTVLFASGSPFPAMCYDGCEPLNPAQANNAYIFPAVGHAAVLTQAKAIPNEVSGGSTVKLLIHVHCSVHFRISSIANNASTCAALQMHNLTFYFGGVAQW